MMTLNINIRFGLWCFYVTMEISFICVCLCICCFQRIQVQLPTRGPSRMRRCSGVGWLPPPASLSTGWANSRRRNSLVRNKHNFIQYLWLLCCFFCATFTIHCNFTKTMCVLVVCSVSLQEPHCTGSWGHTWWRRSSSRSMDTQEQTQKLLARPSYSTSRRKRSSQTVSITWF